MIASTELQSEHATMVNLGGVIPFSSIDWRGKAALVLFLRRCPFRCCYCQNYQLLEADNYVPLSTIEQTIRDNERFIDAVVISGGEPFMQPQVLRAISSFIHSRSLACAVQSNGYYPDAVESLLSLHAIDKLFLDIKAPMDGRAYEELTQAPGSSARVKRTLQLVIDYQLDTELITTVFKHIVGAPEVLSIAQSLYSLGAAHLPYIIQQGRIERIPPHSHLTKANVFSYDELLEIAARVHHTVRLQDIRIRTREKGEEVLYHHDYV